MSQPSVTELHTCKNLKLLLLKQLWIVIEFFDLRTMYAAIQIALGGLHYSLNFSSNGTTAGLFIV
jgi:hypothetical protein